MDVFYHAAEPVLIFLLRVSPQSTKSNSYLTCRHRLGLCRLLYKENVLGSVDSSLHCASVANGKRSCMIRFSTVYEWTLRHRQRKRMIVALGQECLPFMKLFTHLCHYSMLLEAHLSVGETSWNTVLQ